MTTGRINQVPTVNRGLGGARKPRGGGGCGTVGGGVAPAPKAPGQQAAPGGVEAIPITPSELFKGASARRRTHGCIGLRHGALGKGLPAARSNPGEGARASGDP